MASNSTVPVAASAMTAAKRSPLDTLLAMGFPQSRAEKALAATGCRGVHVASDWLLSHLDDPTLDDPAANFRHYYIFLAPGPRSKLGSISGSKSGPAHVNLIPWADGGIVIKDACVENAVDRILKVIREYSADFRHFEKEGLDFEKIILSNNSAGLAVGKEPEKLLTSFSRALKIELSSVEGVAVPPTNPEEINRLTLDTAQPEHFQNQEINSKNQDWEICLYSSDFRLVPREVNCYIVKGNHTPKTSEEIRLTAGDVIYSDQDDSSWMKGTSWLSGCKGYFPRSCVAKCHKSQGWTLHFAAPVKDGVRPTIHQESDILDRLKQTTKRPAAPESIKAKPEGGRRQMYIVRHGERVDFTFGSWIPFSFEKGNYKRLDLNMPPLVPFRGGGPETFVRDCPLTRMGCMQAKLTGEAMKEAGVKISHVYSSPSLRCVQTAQNILVGLELEHLKIHIEPGLFEWLAWYTQGFPDFMSTRDLLEAGYNIDESYEPYISIDELRESLLQEAESVEQYYTRNFFVTRCVLQATEEAGGNVLLVAHGASLDTCSRQVTGNEPRSLQEMMNIVRKISYCGVAYLEEEDEAGSCIKSSSESLNSRGSGRMRRTAWKLREPPFPPMTHCSNPRFDWKCITTDKEQP